MNITEVRVRLMLGRRDKLRAFCSITFDDCFVVRDFKVISGDKGPFVAMPSKKISDKCPQCKTKNHLQSNFCSKCGINLNSQKYRKSTTDANALYVDIAHPIKPDFRKYIQDTVLNAFNMEVEKSKLPGYTPPEIEPADEEKI